MSKDNVESADAEKVPASGIDEHRVEDLEGYDAADLARVISGESRSESDAEIDAKGELAVSNHPLLAYDKAPW